MAPKPVRFCFAILRWAPVLFITAVIVWSYYAYVIQMCIFTICLSNKNIPEGVVYLLLYHPVIFMFGWAYWKTIFAEHDKLPKEFVLSKSDLERFENDENEESQRDILARIARNLPVQCRTASGAIRYCDKCKSIKPDRAHHCSVCGMCIMKMDHHCPWVNNCVGFKNYKFFVLFLGYAFIYCVYVALTSLQYFIKFWTDTGSKDMGKFHILFLFFAAVMFAISLISLFGYHLFLVTVNRSTLESFRAAIFRSGPDKDGFSLGKYGNFIEVFGEDKKMWFLPVFSSCGDGISFPTRVVPPPTSSYNSMESTVATGNTTNDTSVNAGDGVNFPIRTIDEDYDTLLGERQRWMEEGETGEHIPGARYPRGSATNLLPLQQR